jgi:regulator of sigma E protease
VKVLKFSLGFGKVLFQWFDKKGTEFAISLVPLGGYVKMLDETEGPVKLEERHLAFNNKPVLSRIAIVAAGPLFNFVFAFISFWLVLVLGIQSLAPMVAQVKPGSLVAKAGLQPKEEIIGLNEMPIRSWHDFQYALMPLIGSQETIYLKVKHWNDNHIKILSLPLENWHLDPKHPDLLNGLGITAFIPKILPIIGEVLEDSPAKAADLRVGDRILKINKKPIKDWLDLANYVKQHPSKSVSLIISRDGHNLPFNVIVGSKKIGGRLEGFLGLKSQKVNWPKKWLRTHKENPFSAIGVAFNQTVNITEATFVLIGRVVSGKLGMKAISGPVGIAQGAGESARSGLSYFLSFLAVISIGLGVLNLLPIPMLDGGHLFYYLIEIVRRKPLSMQAQSLGMYFGLMLLIGLMFLGIFNDLSRLMAAP